MEHIQAFSEYILNFDEHLASFIDQFGALTYGVLFLIIFVETGLVVMPFLPGDSLLFIVGAFAGAGIMNIFFLWIVLAGAAILGDTVNYWIGHKLGRKVFAKENSRIFKKDYLIKTEKFYEKYGGKAVILARFVPIVRTFAPFVAGIGSMSYPKFITYNIIGGVVWVSTFLFAGFFLGNIPFVKDNFHYMIFIIIGISLLPIVIEYIKHRKEKHQRGKVDFKEIKQVVK
ncbi:DedA family protein [Candidatus Gottesmanbacteria bacterium]|nr:DedA family protein [Candidatus Gottesmanbacteria bacterium]